MQSKLDQFNRAGRSLSRNDCPASEVWTDVAAGLFEPQEFFRRANHAAICSDCASLLRDALDVVGSSAPPSPELALQLKTAERGRQKKLARQMAQRSKAHLAMNSASQMGAGFRFRFFPMQALGYAAGAAAVAIGTIMFLALRPPSPEKLLIRAYADQITIELRLPGSGYGPIQVQRDQRRSPLSSPSSLLEAQYQIKRGLESHPDDPQLLREKAEADLLAGDYQPAIETLGRALRLQAHDPYLLADLATEHFSQGQATESQSDFEAALQYLGDALRLTPNDPAMLFNRAIVYERLSLYSRAIEDWELFLTLEKNDGWKKEGAERLQHVQAALQGGKAFPQK